MKLFLKYLGQWENITKMSQQKLEFENIISIEMLLNYLIGIYGHDFEKELSQGAVYIKSTENKYIVLEMNEKLSDNAEILFLGPIVGG